jgi:hypothetical protein
VPSKRVNNPVIDLSEYDVVGEDGVMPSFVRHVGLSAASGSMAASGVSVHQMGPPLNSSGTIKVDVFGTADLDVGQKQRIKIFKDTHESEHLARKLGKRKGYVICPHVKDEQEEDGTRVFTRFSCVGFVIEAYKNAGIELLVLNAIPSIPIDQVCRAYPDIAEELKDHPKIRGRWGIEGDGPWPVALCGYVIHSLNRSVMEIRKTAYSPQTSDAIFP